MTRPPILRLFPDELVIDNFAGGGGASTGIRAAIGRDPDVAVNHDPEALAIYKANHPGTRVLCEDVFDVEPRMVCGRKKVGLLWASPDCTFFSKARGAKPHRDRNRARRRRGLASVVIKWAAQVRPRVIFVENVEEFQEWGPLIKVGDGWEPDPERRGQSFRRWRSRLENLGYQVELRQLRACDFGAPTSRRRLFIIARCDGEAITWPQPTHGPGRAQPFRTAAECIDWSIPCPSIFERKKPLAEATLRRIARGVVKYVLEAKQPFIVPLTHHDASDRARGVDDVMPTVTGANRGELAVVAPTLERRDRGETLDELAALEAEFIAPTIINTRNGERDGQAPRVRDIRDPMATVTAKGSQGAVVAAFLAKHYGGPNGQQTPGSAAQLPLGTITSQDHHGVVAAHLLKFRGGFKDHQNTAQGLDEPLGTVTAGGIHYAEVRAFLMAYYGTDQDPQLGLPMATVTTRDRFALVTVAGVDYAIVDIGMRMLTPRELFNAQGFPADYVIDPVVDGKPLTKTAQVHKCGNSVCPPLSEALVRANLDASARHRKAVG